MHSLAHTLASDQARGEQDPADPALFFVADTGNTRILRVKIIGAAGTRANVETLLPASTLAPTLLVCAW